MAPAVVALARVLTNPDVICPIVGPKTLEQLETSVPVLDIKLPKEMLTALDRIFPRPGSKAPEAYAW